MNRILRYGRSVLYVESFLAGTVLLALPLFAHGQVILNELMWGGEEYIELYNRSGEAVALDGWRITRQKPDADEETILELNGSVAGGGYYLIKRTEEATSVSANVVADFRLVNSGELIRLYSSGGEAIDTANRQGSWYAGSSADGGYSMERVSADGDGTVKESWVTSAGAQGGRHGTPGSGKEESSPKETSSEEKEGVAEVTPTPEVKAVYSDGVVVNEVLPNPVGSDDEGEFVELHNTTDTTVDLVGWKLDDAEGGSTPFTIHAGTSIKGRSYIVFKRMDTKIALNNDGDQARLISPDGVMRSILSYTASVPEGSSYNREDGGKNSATPTPGSTNVLTAITQESKTPTPTPAATSESGIKTPSPAVRGAATVAYPKTVVISEFMPDPMGSDPEGEFIELHNIGTSAVTLSGWQLDDAEGGSTPHTIPDGTSLKAGAFALFHRAQTGVALNNDKDSVRLLDPNGAVTSTYTYSEKMPEGLSVSRTAGGTYVVGTAATPGSTNATSQTKESITPQAGKEVGSAPVKKSSGISRRASQTKTTAQRAQSSGSRQGRDEALEGYVAGVSTDSVQKRNNAPSRTATTMQDPRRSATRSMLITLGVGAVCVLALGAVTNREPILQYMRKMKSLLTIRDNVG